MNAPSNTSAFMSKPRDEVRNAVQMLLTNSEAYAAMPQAKQVELARNLALISDYLVAPEGIEGHRIPGGLGMPTAKAMAEPAREGTFQEHQAAVDEIGKGNFDSSAVNAGVTAAINYVQGIN